MKYRSLFVSTLVINLTLSTISIAEVDVKMTSDTESVKKHDAIIDVKITSENDSVKVKQEEVAEIDVKMTSENDSVKVKQEEVAEVDVTSDNVKQDDEVDVNQDPKCVKKVQKPVGVIEREDAKVISDIETVQKLDEKTDSVTTPGVINITAEFESVTVMHNGKEVVIKRNQDENNTINPEFAKTSRSCPPFCINPMNLAPGIETIGELEVLSYLKKMSSGDNSILVIDSRTPEWIIKGSIPGAVNIPWDVFSGTSTPIINKLLEEQLGVKVSNFFKDFENAKTLVLFCNGPWCLQSPTNIKTLLGFGYPPEKLKWYRGGMQAWESFGLTTVTDISMPWLGL